MVNTSALLDLNASVRYTRENTHECHYKPLANPSLFLNLFSVVLLWNLLFKTCLHPVHPYRSATGLSKKKKKLHNSAISCILCVRGSCSDKEALIVKLTLIGAVCFFKLSFARDITLVCRCQVSSLRIK